MQRADGTGTGFFREDPPEGAPVTLLMIDADGFKGINDTYGHATGDSDLQTAAEVMCEGVRSTDIATRDVDEFGPDASAGGSTGPKNSAVTV